jgi:glycosyltransferase involved in cell wall biosynthesis
VNNKEVCSDITIKRTEENPLISIITVCFNSSKTISKTIGSILHQTSRRFEYIIIDGGSTDGTIEIITSFEPFFRDFLIPFKWKSEKDSGIYDAMNKGISLSKGNFVALLNSDDWYNPDTIENVINALLENPDIGVFHGIVKFWKSNIIHTLHGASELFIEFGSFPPHSTCFIKKSVYDLIGSYDTTFPIAADYDMLIRIKKAGVGFFLIEKVLSNFSMHGVSSMRPLSIDVISIQKKHGLISKGRYYILKPIYLVLNFLYPFLK